MWTLACLDGTCRRLRRLLAASGVHGAHRLRTVSPRPFFPGRLVDRGIAGDPPQRGYRRGNRCLAVITGMVSARPINRATWRLFRDLRHTPTAPASMEGCPLRVPLLSSAVDHSWIGRGADAKRLTIALVGGLEALADQPNRVGVPRQGVVSKERSSSIDPPEKQGRRQSAQRTASLSCAITHDGLADSAKERRRHAGERLLYAGSCPLPPRRDLPIEFTAELLSPQTSGSSTPRSTRDPPASPP